ncbi:glutathione S-transferase protein-like protein [Astrocystis sublimbata]|nr:glutathione S-transferase protein-like protein [Astrocystis sublimbata]
MDAPYELIYWCSCPARGEHIRLALEEAGAPYSDTLSLGMEKCWKKVEEYIADDYMGESGNPPYYAPPFFKHGSLMISQTSNILMYLGPRLGLSGSKEGDAYRVNALALTALDGLSDEVHQTHHPIAHDLFWEDQKEESRRCSKEWVKDRLPKHLGFWDKVLKCEKALPGAWSMGESEASPGPWLLGDTFTYADLVLFQCIDGVLFAFPRAMKQAKDSGKYDRVFQLHDAVAARPNIAAYLSSNRRQEYNIGIYRYYEENDVLPEE